MATRPQDPVRRKAARDTAMIPTSWFRWRRRNEMPPRSVFFYRNSYYHFYYLARALRARGWDAVSVSLDDPKGSFAMHFHGEDMNLYHPREEKMRRTTERFFKLAKTRFQIMHFSGDHCMSFFGDNFDSDNPQDIVEWKALGKTLAYTVSGCNSGITPTSLAKWSQLESTIPVCRKCPWESKPRVCSDERSIRWGEKVKKYCDLVFSETLPPLDYMAIPSVIRDPVTVCLDTEVWRPNLQIPSKFKIERQENEFTVYHGVGNYEARLRDGKNIKGTSYIKDAIDRLNSEGHRVRWIFATDVANKDVRFLQSQADVVIDQLNVGMYGASAREGMMLGKPVICYIHKSLREGPQKLDVFRNCPLIPATEESIYEVLKNLVQNRNQLAEIGSASRAFAVKWHGAEECAERYEKIMDRLHAERTLAVQREREMQI